MKSCNNCNSYHPLQWAKSSSVSSAIDWTVLDLYHSHCFLISPSAVGFTSSVSTAFLEGWEGLWGGGKMSPGTYWNNSFCLTERLWGLSGMPFPQSSRCWTRPRAHRAVSLRSGRLWISFVPPIPRPRPVPAAICMKIMNTRNSWELAMRRAMGCRNDCWRYSTSPCLLTQLRSKISPQPNSMK